MLIITSLAAAALAVCTADAASHPAASPPMIVTVVTLADVRPSLVTRVLEEADLIWRASGVTFVWRTVPRATATRLDPAPAGAGALRIVIGDGHAVSHDGRLPLGWIEFDDGAPAKDIHLSYRNAVTFMANSPGVAGLITQMPPLEIEIKLARAMGRALAHELGHYLLASKAHTRRGLMQASHTASEFFEYSRRGFSIDAAQRQAIAARLREDAVVVSR
jgi:hypothetical protein